MWRTAFRLARTDLGRRRKRVGLVLAGFVTMAALLVVGADGLSDDGSGLARKSAAGRPLNVLFIILDTTPAARMSLYGYHRPTTPFVDSLAGQGVYFTNAHSQASATPGSTWSFMTGRYPYKFRVRQDRDTTLARVFRENGYATGGFVENPWIASRFGFQQGFDVYEYFEWKKAQRGKYEDIYFRTEGSSEDLTETAAEWVDQNADRPWFCYVHLMRPHTPYIAPEPFRLLAADDVPELAIMGERELAQREKEIILKSRHPGYVPPENDLALVSGMYDGNLAYVDELVRRLHDELDREGHLDNTLIIVASDHGEAFGEHGQMMHDNVPYEEVVHVPLVMRFPVAHGRNCGPIDGYVELLDLMPTILDAAGLPAPDGIQGASLIPMIDGRGDPVHKVFGFSHNVKTRSVAVRMGDMKLIAHTDRQTAEPQRYELYNLLHDPHEREAATHPERIPREMIARLRWYLDTRERSIFDAAARPGELDAETMAEVEALGYL